MAPLRSNPQAALGFFDVQMDVGDNPRAGRLACDPPVNLRYNALGTMEQTYAFSPRAISWVG